MLFLIFVLAFAVRFYNYTDRIIFGPEQALSLITSGEYLSEKFSLLGQPDLIRNTSTGFVVFQGALFNYSLVPLQIIFGYDPLSITVFFTLLNLFTGLVIFVLVRRHFDTPIAITSAILFLFNDYMVAHSLFVWILNYLPLLGILIIDRLLSKNTYSHKNIFILGLLCGTSFALQYAVLFVSVPLFVCLILRSPWKWSTAILFFVGAVIPNLPTIIFDLKHNLFHFWVLWQSALDVFSGKSPTHLSYYHFLNFWPLLCIFAAITIHRYLRRPVIAMLFLTVYVFLGLYSPRVSLLTPPITPYPTYSDVLAVATFISKQPEQDYNIAAFFDFDTRALPLRYLLQFVFKHPPQGKGDYNSAKVVYIFTPNKEVYTQSQAHEKESISFLPLEILAEVPGKYQLYKVTNPISTSE